MTKDIFAKHIGGSSELTLLAPIKPGLVPIRDTLSYAARLRLHLRMLDALRRNGLETDRAGVYLGPVDGLRTLQFVRWTLVNDDRDMLLAVNFDRPIEPYVRRIVDVAGPLLDTILCHCVGFDGHSSDLGFEGFFDFARRHQAPVELFVAASPNLSVDDGDYGIEADAARRDPKTVANPAATFRFKTPAQKLQAVKDNHRLPLLEQSLNIIRVFAENAERFPRFDAAGVETRDDFFYYRLAETLVPGFWKGIAEKIGEDVGAAIPVETEVQRLALLNSIALNGQAPAQGAASLLRGYGEPLDWFARKPVREAPVLATAPPGDIQTGLMGESIGATHACLLLLRVDDPAGGRQFLKAMGDMLWPAANAKVSANLSITNDGLKALGVAENVRARFPTEFREGMAARAGLLGDIDVNHPRDWVWPAANWPLGTVGRGVAPEAVDLIVQVQISGNDADPHHVFDKTHPLLETVNTLAALAESNSVALMRVDPMHRRFNPAGPTGARSVAGQFGFADGISQPDFKQGEAYTLEREAHSRSTTTEGGEIGDLLVGHRSSRDVRLTATADAPLKDGTFQVIRKMSVDTKRFDTVIQTLAAQNAGISADEIAEKLVGRKKDGTPLIGAPGRQNFNYAGDPNGAQCPLQSHVRRANPRREDTPRILRRGFSYGPREDQDDDDRGLMFIAYNASIAEQYEVIQRWINGGNSTGISSWHGDPLLAPIRADGVPVFEFPHNGKLVRFNLGEKPFSTLEWGLYAFVPSKDGLAALAADPAAHAPGDGIEAIMARRITGADPAARATQWKTLLEDRDENRRDERDALWDAIRTGGKALRTEYGVLVGARTQVLEVLRDRGEQFSVRRYWDRMRVSVGPQYLGYDPEPTALRTTADADLDTEYRDFLGAPLPSLHDQDAATMGGYLAGVTEAQAFGDARDAARRVLAALPEEWQPLRTPGVPGHTVKPLGRRVGIRRFIHDVLAELCVEWFGLPRDKGLQIGGPYRPVGADRKAHLPEDVLSASISIFGPDPSPEQARRGREDGALLRRRIEEGLNFGSIDGTLLGQLRNDQAIAPARWTDAAIATFLAGACLGFAGPVSGAFRAILFDWIDTGLLSRARQKLAETQAESDLDRAQKSLGPLLRKSLVTSSAIDLVHRVAVAGGTLGGVAIAPGDRVVVSLRSAAEGGAIPDDRDALMFGAAPSGQAGAPTAHGCPGRSAGFNVLLGCLFALLDGVELREEGPMVLRRR